MSWIEATYRFRLPAAEVPAAAQALALEQSVEVPPQVVRDRFIAENIVGRVAHIRACDDGTHTIVVRLATATTGYDVAQTLNMLFGNSSLHEHVELVDVEFPDDLIARFPGPRYGIEGVRAETGAYGRPLTCAALKPQGLSTERLAALCETFARAGVDVIKDDHGIADQEYSPFAQRVEACQRAIERAAAATGRRAVYAPSLVGSPRTLATQARVAREAGARMVLMIPALLGLPAFAEAVRETIDVPVLAHPGYAGTTRIAPPLVFGKLYRWLGADAVIYPNFGSRFAYSEATCRAIAERARAPWSHLRPVLPVPGGGLAVERVPQLLRFYGDDVMLLIGGSLLAAGDALYERARGFVEVVHGAARDRVAASA